MSKVNDFFKNRHKVRWAGDLELFTAQEVVEKYTKAFPETSLVDISKLCAVFEILPTLKFKQKAV